MKIQTHLKALMIELKKDGLTYYSEHVEYILSMLDVDPKEAKFYKNGSD
jgi:hypothetical protein